MVNHIRPNLFIYESDILNLGGSVTYDGKIFCFSKRSSLKGAYLSIAKEIYHVKMECFRDGTAAIVGVDNHKGSHLFDTFWQSLELDKNALYHEYLFLRIVKQVLLFIAQTIMLILSFHGFVTSFHYKSIWSFGITITAFFAFLLLGTFYSKIRCRTFKEYKKQVEKYDYSK